MNWAARVLVTGILAVIAVVLVASAISIAAPYLALGLVLWLFGKALLGKIKAAGSTPNAISSKSDPS